VTETPRVRIEPFRTEGTSGNWTVRWKLINEGDRPIRLLSAQHPHSQFRTPRTSLDRDVAPREETDIVLRVRFTELPGVMVENPFLILVFRQGGDWRLLARVQVTAGSKGEPLAGQSVVVTMQRVGTP
jgi:hypothetical protein